MPEFEPGLSRDRLGAILALGKKWVNGTVLRYYFFDRETDGSQVPLPDGTRRLVSWLGSKDQQDVVRESFRAWKGLPLCQTSARHGTDESPDTK